MPPLIPLTFIDEDDHSDLDGPNSRKENSKDQDDGLSDDSWDDLKDEDSEDDDEMQVDDAPTANGLAGNGNDGTATGAGNVGVGGANDFEARAAQAMRDIAALQVSRGVDAATVSRLDADADPASYSSTLPRLLSPISSLKVKVKDRVKPISHLPLPVPTRSTLNRIKFNLPPPTIEGEGGPSLRLTTRKNRLIIFELVRILLTLLDGRKGSLGGC